MHAISRHLIICMIAALVAAAGFTAVTLDPASAVSKKPVLSKTTVTMKAQTTVKLKVKKAHHKVKWKSSDPDMVQILKVKGKYKKCAVLKSGTKAGTCIVKAKSGKRTMICTVTVEASGLQEPEGEDKPLSESTVDLTENITAGTVDAASASEVYKNAVSECAVDLLQLTVKQEQAETGKTNVGNILISPESVLTALAMAENGAEGKTLKEMEKVMSAGDPEELTAGEFNRQISTMNTRLCKNSNPNVKYTTANSIWAKKGSMDVKEDFLQKNKTYHQASFFEAPFNEDTVSDVNAWVYNNTRHMIDKIIKEFSKDSRMLLINTIAFEGQWEEPFREDLINKEGKFKNAEGDSETVSMLSGTLNKAGSPYIEVAGGTGAVKVYHGGDFAFAALLPPEGMSLETYVAKLTGKDFIEGWKNRSNKYDVHLLLPEFKFDYAASMKKPLQEMGIQEAFTDDADFSGIIEPTAETEALKISDVLHKTHIEVDRSGTKAAAATAIVFEKVTSVPGEEEIRKICLDRPFVCAIVDVETGLPLFLGMVETCK